MPRRVTQQAVELAAKAAGKVRATEEAVEALGTQGASLRATEEAVEALSAQTATLRATEAAFEDLVHSPTQLLVTEQAIELLVPNLPYSLATLPAELWIVAPVFPEPDGDEPPAAPSWPPNIISVGGTGPSVGTASGIVGIYEAEELGRNILVVEAVIPPVRAVPIAQLRLYRAPTTAGPWSGFPALGVDPDDVNTLLFDASPIFGSQMWYAVATVDADGVEGPRSPAASYAAYGPGTIQNAAYGAYAVLGQDVFLNPQTGEGVIGPNGDLVTVRGLACLAQDLRIRILSLKGELLLHPEYGFARTVGVGQARPDVQAQILRANVIDAISADPRVAALLLVEVSRSDDYSWVVSYEVRAIGVEDPQRANLVVPFDRSPQ